MSSKFVGVDTFDGGYACVVLAFALGGEGFFDYVFAVGEAFDVVLDALVADLSVVADAALPCVA